MSSKNIDAGQFAAGIEDYSVLLFTSDASLMVCDGLLGEIERRFLETGHPRGLTVVQPCNGFLGVGTGIDRLMHQGLTRTLITSILPADRRSRAHALLESGGIDVVLFPMGVLYAWLRENAAGRPGLFSRSGLGTFVEDYVDRQFTVGRNVQTLVRAAEINGEPYLHYQPIRIDAALVRATSTDRFGNLSFEREPLILDPLAVALNGRASGGKCYAQAERLVADDERAPRNIRVPGFLVDAFCILPDPAHSIVGPYNPDYANERRSELPAEVRLSLDKEIAVRRTIAEIAENDLVNLGVGAGAYAPSIMARSPHSRSCTFVTEHGSVGGVPVGDVNFFGVHLNAHSIINPSEMFSIYSAGLLDVSILGFAQADEAGNVNVSRLGDRSNGAGGFMDISHNSRKIVFCGSFTTGKLEIALKDNRLSIVRDGSIRKFVRKVDEVTFSYRNRKYRDAEILFITERCVLKMVDGVYHLIEVAPGLSIAEDIVARIPFDIVVGEKPKEMEFELLGLRTHD
jgi:propionate CoA-transferase